MIVVILKKTLSCGCIGSSLGENNITTLLLFNEIPFINQYGINIDDKWYRYDFAILNEDKTIKRLIEFDGIQHSDNTQLHWGKTSYSVQ